MNRKQRRQQASQKAAVAAKPQQDKEKSSVKTSMVQVDAANMMRAIVETCQERFPGLDITLFVSTRPDFEKKDQNPEFNYASTAPRAHVMAIIAAFVDAEYEKDQKTVQKPN